MLSSFGLLKEKNVLEIDSFSVSKKISPNCEKCKQKNKQTKRLISVVKSSELGAKMEPPMMLKTNEIIKKKSLVSLKIQENKELTSKLNKQKDNHSEDRKEKLKSLQLRTQYYEAQLNILEAHHQLNVIRSSQTSSANWKEDLLNLKTTEATLENLYLEYQYLMKKVDNNEGDISIEDEDFISEPTIQKKKSDEEIFINLKPLKCISRSKYRNSSSKKTDSGNSNSQVAEKVRIPTKEDIKNNKQKWESAKKSLNIDIKIKHNRCNSLPESIDSEFLTSFKQLELENQNVPENFNTNHNCTTRNNYSNGKITSNNTSTSTSTNNHNYNNNSNGRKFNLRHFMSHDTGLKVKIKDYDEESVYVKDGEILNSPTSNFLLNSSKPNTKAPTTTIIEEDIYEESTKVDSTFIDESTNPFDANETILEDDSVENLNFKPLLKRANSCDSIFSVKSKKPIQPVMRDNRQQTLNWLNQFSKNTKFQSTVSTENATVSINSLSNSSRSLLSNLSSTSASTATASPQIAAVTIPRNTQTSTTTQTSYHSFEQTYTSQNTNNWSNFMSRFKSNSLLPAHTQVTSEVGRQISVPKAIKIPASSATTAPKAKGSVSTLTIGPNRSKVIHYAGGIGGALSEETGQSFVHSTEISQDALRDALTNPFEFES